MQSNRFGVEKNVVDNPTCVPGAVSDNSDYSNVTTYAANRRNTIFIPTEHKFVKVELAEGYLAYLFQYDEDFEFIREDGWMDDVYAHSLELNCKYIRISIKVDGYLRNKLNTCTYDVYSEWLSFSYYQRKRQIQIDLWHFSTTGTQESPV